MGEDIENFQAIADHLSDVVDQLREANRLKRVELQIQIDIHDNDEIASGMLADARHDGTYRPAQEIRTDG